MTGLLFIGLGILWFVLVCGIAVFAFRKLPKGILSAFVSVLLFIALLPLPLIDEIVGKRQFEKLCTERATIQTDRAKAAGRTVYLAKTSSIEEEGTWVRVTVQPWRYVDAKTGETIVSYNTLQAERRFFLTGFGLLTFDGYCAPGGSRSSVKSLFQDLGITDIKRPANMEGQK
jgi:hypothetical protein